VRGPTAAATAWGSALRLASTSANTGRAPTRTIAPTVAKNDSGVVTISSPGPQPSAIAIASSASVPELVPTARATPVAAASARSKPSTSAPPTKPP
jgi:hypothetical protein